MEISAKYKHSKFGNLMFNLCAKWTEFLVKHHWLYYILAITWGIFLTIFGIIITIFLFILKCFNWKNIKFNKYYWVYLVKIGKYWGGLETGLMFVRDSTSTESVSEHEFGHSFQNCLFGPFQIIWSLTSVARYWYRELKYERKGKACPTNYDSYWLEDSASQCGKFVVEYLRNKKYEKTNMSSNK